MSFHTDHAEWLRLSDQRKCPVCNQEPMPSEMVEIVELPHSWLCAEPVECLRGACHLVARKHAIELFDLSDEELLAWMKEVALCARALKTVSGAVKINYEIHGNTVPHLHMHLYPRYFGEPFAGQPIDYRRKERLYTESEFDRFVARMRHEIGLLT
jgi:diadenosine tetraphosphate (Ap4A) HIT family hydrolase